MTIDERLDRLTERHEALAQALEIVVSMQRENETHLDRLATMLEKNAERIDKMTGHIEGLVRIAEAHQHRLDRIEGQRQ